MKNNIDSKHILFLINGLGMGNSTRCFSVIQQLHKLGFTVDIATSGNGLIFFKDKTEINRIYPMGSMYYGKSKDNKLNVFKTLLAILPSLATFVRNGLTLLKICRETSPVAIIYDSQYNLLPIISKNKVIALNNSDMVVHFFFRMKDKPFSIFPQFICIELMDFLFHKFFPNRVVSPWVDPQAGGATHAYLTRVPLIVREGIFPVAKTSPGVGKVLIMLSGSTFGQNIDPTNWGLPYHFDIVGREGVSTERVKFHGKLVNNVELLRGADILVINAGFSAVSEALVLRKPVIVIPVENHAEQYINARIVEDLGVGLAATHDLVKERLKQVIESFDRFSSNYEKFEFTGDGAKKFAAVVDEITHPSQFVVAPHRNTN